MLTYLLELYMVWFKPDLDQVRFFLVFVFFSLMWSGPVLSPCLKKKNQSGPVRLPSVRLGSVQLGYNGLNFEQ